MSTLNTQNRTMKKSITAKLAGQLFICGGGDET
jgi:hypothetical protein